MSTQLEKTNDLLARLQEVCKLAPERRHSYFQLKYFVIGKETTTQGRMWQCLREIQTRKDSIENLFIAIEETKDQIKLLEIKLSKFDKKQFDNEVIKEIKGRQLARKKTTLEKTLIKLEEDLEFCLQEARFFMQMLDVLMKEEDLKDFDDYDSQKEYWNEKISQQINLKMLLQQPLDTELVRTALSLNEDAPIRLQTEKTLQHIEGQMELMRLQYVQKLKSHELKEKNAITQSNESE
jgi:hypothetical protein